MMKVIFLVILPLAWCYGSSGGGAYSYVDSSGNRYGGTYGLKDGQVVSRTGDGVPTHFSDSAYDGDFGPSYFANLENFLQEAFQTNFENQRLAFIAARKAFDLTSNLAAGYHPNIPSRFPAFNEFPGAGFPGAGFPGAGFPGAGFPGYGMQFPPHNFQNAAFASAAAGPGYNHHIASIYPGNPGNPNIEKINHYSDSTGPKDTKFYSVSSNSFASSQNVNGKESSQRGAETVVNDNGKITHYKVRS